MIKILLLSLLVAIATVYVDSHGRLWEPPGRGTEWRRGFDVPEEKKDYNDIELYCGGRGVSLLPNRQTIWSSIELWA